MVDPQFLSLQERELIHDLYFRGTSIRFIAVTLARSPSTIRRELGRNQQHSVGCLPYVAHRATVLRRMRPKLRKLQPASELRRYVSGKLMRKRSPISTRFVRVIFHVEIRRSETLRSRITSNHSSPIEVETFMQEIKGPVA